MGMGSPYLDSHYHVAIPFHRSTAPQGRPIGSRLRFRVPWAPVVRAVHDAGREWLFRGAKVGACGCSDICLASCCFNFTRS